MKIDQCSESSFKNSIFLSENYLLISWLESKFSKLNKFEFWQDTEAANRAILWKKCSEKFLKIYWCENRCERVSLVRKMQSSDSL